MKIIIVAVSALGLIIFSSCNKTYTCVCSEPTGNTGKNYTFNAKNKSNAEAICAAEEGYSYGAYLTCELQ